MSRSKNAKQLRLRGRKRKQSSVSRQTILKHGLPPFLIRVKNAAEAGEIPQAINILAEAAEYLTKNLRLNFNDVEHWRLFGVHLITMGEMYRGVELLQKSVEAMPWSAAILSYHLYSLHHLPDISIERLFEEHKRWGQLHAPANLTKTSHNNSPEPDRRLRVGYISADFRHHPVPKFFESLLDGRNREVVEVYGYANVKSPDEMTQYLKPKFDYYRNIVDLDDKSVIDMIERDKIDILVDLAGHTDNNRLGVLARKPAPIQVTYLGYPGTTGLEQIDYRFTDVLAEPADSQDFHTEELIFLPEGFLCYKPPTLCPALTPPPVMRKGYITFSSFNNSGKVNPDIMTLWAEVLRANEGSRFLMKFQRAGEQKVRDHYYRQFERLGIDRERVEIHGWKTFVEHMQLYSEVDIALDVYPYNGTTTTCEALWMGVPVISLVGQRHVSRVGLSLLSRVGMEFFACSARDEYIAKATALAKKPESLAKIRASMRARMLETLCNREKFAKHIEQAYREMWHKWCRNQTVEITDSKRDIAKVTF
ncbi:MAG: hypothetical protein WC476_04485 [Phycisphaerae bacterium]|jgi:predicted O-linked N-acetylglucosamine transferase (SPINDLY family)